MGGWTDGCLNTDIFSNLKKMVHLIICISKANDFTKQGTPNHQTTFSNKEVSKEECSDLNLLKDF